MSESESESEAQDVEALSDSIVGCFSNVSDLPGWMQVPALGRYMRPLTLLAARAVLASDWLAQAIADAKAETWEQAIATATRQIDLTDLMHFDKPSDFSKGVLTTIAALNAARVESEAGR